ncbi:hypothetical protein [Tsukamurella ocularis]|uniref:hypothetical protein n=1 Tax=Tsukamurella ocularis TaxID=1970234 RepID=UPI0021688DC3|nr:hypothetical protein [Tsukamurella ocularis]MCS3782393.1 hypothetical protein [Tsukamurella ocularis]MCS3789798.1 hypothetical protein [Tsukamurella ocularis]MCS3853183.1 hypothetical protein [Tsukamurella ocularis]
MSVSTDDAAARHHRSERKTFAWRMVGLFIGAILLCGCAASVTALPSWGQTIGVPWVFLGFTLVMLLASQLAVAGGQALWGALRDDDA